MLSGLVSSGILLHWGHYRVSGKSIDRGKASSIEMPGCISRLSIDAMKMTNKKENPGRKRGQAHGRLG